MRDRVRVVSRVVATAAVVALLISALPGNVVSAASAKACKVYNLDQKIGRNTLQRAVWAAAPGDRLVVRGTCIGTTYIRKDLRIRGMRVRSASSCTKSGCSDGGTRDSGPATLRSGSWRPTLVIDPSVDVFGLDRSVTLRQGFVIDDLDDWRAATSPTALAWNASTHRASGTSAAATTNGTASGCTVYNHRSGVMYGHLPTAIDAAAPRDRLTLSGTCRGRASVDKSVFVRGSLLPGDAGCHAVPNPAVPDATICIDYTSEAVQRPIIGRSVSDPAIVVSPDAEHVLFKRLTIRGGIRISD